MQLLTILVNMGAITGFAAFTKTLLMPSCPVALEFDKLKMCFLIVFTPTVLKTKFNSYKLQLHVKPSFLIGNEFGILGL